MTVRFAGGSYNGAILAIAAVGLSAMGSVATSQTTVYVDASAAGDQNGRSWEHAYTDLQAALDDAAMSGGISGEIWVAVGVYRPSRRTDADDPRSATFQLLNGVGLYGGFAGWETERCQRHPADNVTILSGDLDDDDDTPISDSDCCVAHDSPGCETAECQELVCAKRARCCEEPWSESCVALTSCLCGKLCERRCDNTYHVVTGSGTDSTATIDGFKITAGYAREDSDVFSDGAGMIVVGASPTVIGCTFAQNEAKRGGGMFNANASPIISGCVFDGNTAEGKHSGSGGGMGNTDSAPTLTNCRFTRNTVEAPGYGCGSGMGNFYSNPVLIGCRFEANEGGSASLSSAWSPTRLDRCVFQGNVGGGFAMVFDNAVLTRCTFLGNSADSGGAMRISGHEDTLLTCVNCRFLGNRATESSGGAIQLWREADVGLIGCVFSGNSAAWSAGAIDASYGGDITLINSTLTGNSADWVGGVYTEWNQQAFVFNSILWGNRHESGDDSFAQISHSEQLHVRFSCIQGWFATETEMGNISLDPLFRNSDGSDGIPGTLDDDLRLMPGSPCIDVANNLLIARDTADVDGDGDTIEPLPFDVAGAPRFYDDPNTPDMHGPLPPLVDMGAYEFFDCNLNGVRDDHDIKLGNSQDCTCNGIPDECEPDCNENGAADSCDIASRESADCSGNGVPDECEPDCNGNGEADSCDIADGTSQDLNENGVPDECQRRVFVDADATGGNDGTSWTDAYVELQSAVTEAENGAGTITEIWVAEGRYRPSMRVDADDPRSATFPLLKGVALLGGFAGWESERSQRNPRLHETILTGDLQGDDEPDLYNREDNAYHVVTASWTDRTAVLDGFVVTGGFGWAEFVEHRGAGMLSVSGSPTLDNCIFRDNTADSAGGAIAGDLYAAPRIRNCVFEDNMASLIEGLGGAVSSSLYGAPEISGCLFRRNTANLGGGIHVQSSDSTIDNSLFHGNFARAGGGVHMLDSTVSVTNCTLAGNNVSWTSGGGD